MELTSVAELRVILLIILVDKLNRSQKANIEIFGAFLRSRVAPTENSAHSRANASDRARSNALRDFQKKRSSGARQYSTRGTLNNANRLRAAPRRANRARCTQSQQSTTSTVYCVLYSRPLRTTIQRFLLYAVAAY